MTRLSHPDEIIHLTGGCTPANLCRVCAYRAATAGTSPAPLTGGGRHPAPTTPQGGA